MQLNIDQLELDLCRQMAVIDMIKKSKSKAMHLACSNYYKLFGTYIDMVKDVKHQNEVTNRLVSYLVKLRRTA